jgi:hypothetical protein
MALPAGAIAASATRLDATDDQHGKWSRSVKPMAILRGCQADDGVKNAPKSSNISVADACGNQIDRRAGEL